MGDVEDTVQLGTSKVAIPALVFLAFLLLLSLILHLGVSFLQAWKFPEGSTPRKADGLLLSLGLWVEFMIKLLRDTIDKNVDTIRILVLSLTGVVGWYFLIQHSGRAIRNSEIANQNTTFDRLSLVMDQLSSNSASTHMGGILHLEKIMEDQEDERKKAARFLSDYIREHASKKKNSNNAMGCVERREIEIAVRVLARVGASLRKDKRKYCNLQGADLRDLDFRGSDLSYFRLTGADLTSAKLQKANLADAYIDKVNLTNAWLDETDISSADFRNARGLLQDQLNQAFFREGYPPENLPKEPEELIPPRPRNLQEMRCRT